MNSFNYVELITYATKAPSGHNSQPWKFKIKGDTVEIHPDYSRELRIVDSNHRELFISLGCAVENLVLAGKALGLHAQVHIPQGQEDIIRVAFEKGLKPDKTDHHILTLIDQRQSNRRIYTGKPIPQADLTRLQNVEPEEGVAVRVITDPQTKQILRDLIREGNTEQMKDPMFKEELLTWMRFNKHEVQIRGDGLTYASLGNPALPFRILAKMIVRSFLKPQKQNQRDSDLLESASAFMIFSVQKNDKTSWIRLGRYFERVALEATELGIAHSHYNQPFEVKSVMDKINALTFLNGAIPCLLIRLGYGEPMPYSPRRTIEQVMLTDA